MQDLTPHARHKRVRIAHHPTMPSRPKTVKWRREDASVGSGLDLADPRSMEHSHIKKEAHTAPIN